MSQDEQNPPPTSSDPAQLPTKSQSSHHRHSTIDPLKSASLAKPPLYIQPSAYIDGSSLTGLRGTPDHPFSLGAHALIHPRTILSTEHGPLSIGDKSVIASKCVVGVPSSVRTSSSSEQNSAASLTQGADALGIKQNATTIGNLVQIHPGVQILFGSTISSYALLEPNVVISTGCMIGEHSKVCANTTLPPNTVVPAWTVVWGTNGKYRKRRRGENDTGGFGLEETSRIYALDKEREAGIALLRAAAKQTLSSGSKSKR